MALLEVKTVSRYIEVFRPDGSLLSRHVTVEDAIESAANSPAGVLYRVRYPERTVRVIGTLNPQTGDIEAPTIPGIPTLVSKSATTIAVTAAASSDNVGVTGYQWFLNGLPITTTVNPSHTFTGLTPSTAYAVTVVAFDAAGNSSATSQTLNETTNANAAPAWNVSQQELTTGTGYSLDLLSVCSDADTNPLTFSIVSGTLPTGLTFSAVLKTISGTPTVVQSPTVTLRANDGVVNSDQAVVFNVLNADTTAPPVPAMAEASSISTTGLTASWGAVTDPSVANARTSGNVQYVLQRATDSAFTAGVVTEVAQAGTSKALVGLSSNTLYYLRVRSQDAAGNQSAFSSAVHAFTAPAAAMQFQETGEAGSLAAGATLGGDGTAPTYYVSGGADGSAIAGTRFFSWTMNNGDTADDHSFFFQPTGTPGSPNPLMRRFAAQFACSYEGSFGLGSGEQKLAIFQYYRATAGSFSNANRKYQVIPCVLANGQYAIDLTELDDSGNFLRNAFIGQTSTSFGPANAANQWDVLRVEVELDTNGSAVGSEYGVGFGNGTVRLWRNNTLIVESTNVNICRGEIVVLGRSFCTVNHSSHTWTAATQKVYFDQFQVANTIASLDAMPSSAVARISTVVPYSPSVWGSVVNTEALHNSVVRGTNGPHFQRTWRTTDSWSPTEGYMRWNILAQAGEDDDGYDIIHPTVAQRGIYLSWVARVGTTWWQHIDANNQTNKVIMFYPSSDTNPRPTIFLNRVTNGQSGPVAYRTLTCDNEAGGNGYDEFDVHAFNLYQNYPNHQYQEGPSGTGWLFWVAALLTDRTRTYLWSRSGQLVGAAAAAQGGTWFSQSRTASAGTISSWDAQTWHLARLLAYVRQTSAGDANSYMDISHIRVTQSLPSPPAGFLL